MATTTNYSWTTPDNTAYVKDGASAIRTLGSSVDTTLFTALGGAYPGLRLIKKQTIGTGVSSVAVTGAFSSTYDNYKIMLATGVGSGTNYLTLQLGSTTTGYYSGLSSTLYSTGAFLGANTNNGAAFGQAGWLSTEFLSLDVDLINPNLLKRTVIKGTFAGTSVGGAMGGVQDSNTAFTGFTIIPGGGVTMTGGTIYVYGYGAS
jgi:hypothetical protein